MTLQDALRDVRKMLIAASIEDDRLESEILLMHVLGIDRVQLYLDLYKHLDSQSENTFRQLVQRRISGEPTAYIIGHREFYGLDFSVNQDVLIPRPETELLVEKVLALAQTNHISTIADIGTGSGAIAVSLALNLPSVTIYATDASVAALEVARRNCERHSVTERVHLLYGNMLAPLPQPVDLIVANLPYVRNIDIPAAGPLSFEPRSALDGGPDGLDKIHQLIAELPAKLNPNGHVLLEIGQGQHEGVVALLHEAFPSCSVETALDLGGIERVVVLTVGCPDDKLITTPRHSRKQLL